MDNLPDNPSQPEPQINATRIPLSQFLDNLDLASTEDIKHACSALTKMDPSILHALIPHLTSKKRQRREAAQTLLLKTHKTSISQLIPAVKGYTHLSIQERVAAIQVLGEITDSVVIDCLLELLEAHSPKLREAAKHALVNIGPDAYEKLSAKLDTGSYWVRQTVIALLATRR
jgi:HEAT repeat protein